jgi:hypothetical protein
VVSAHFPFFPNPFIAIAIAGAVTMFIVDVALGYPFAGAVIAGVVGAGGMVVSYSRRNSENHYTGRGH